MGKNKYNIPAPKDISNPNERFDIRKHKSDNFSQIKKKTPVYSFQYVSLEKGDVCFNGDNISLKDFHRLFDTLKKYSIITYEDMDRDKKTYHWHEVKWRDISLKEKDFQKCLTPNITDDIQTPTVYQFDVFKEARIMGFIHNGIFYVVWLDRNHNAYKRN